MKYSERTGIFLYEESEVVRVIRNPYDDGESVLTGVRDRHIEWVEEMDEWCGERAVISVVDESDGTYKINGSDYWWCNNFFESEPFVNEEDCDIELPTMDAASFFGLFEVNL